MEVRFHAADGSYRRYLYQVEHDLPSTRMANSFKWFELEIATCQHETWRNSPSEMMIDVISAVKHGRQVVT